MSDRELASFQVAFCLRCETLKPLVALPHRVELVHLDDEHSEARVCASCYQALWAEASAELSKIAARVRPLVPVQE